MSAVPPVVDIEFELKSSYTKLYVLERTLANINAPASPI
jgi:hypothetical protein